MAKKKDKRKALSDDVLDQVAGGDIEQGETKHKDGSITRYTSFTGDDAAVYAGENGINWDGQRDHPISK